MKEGDIERLKESLENRELAETIDQIVEKRVEKKIEKKYENKEEEGKDVSRREFLKKLGTGMVGLGALGLSPVSALDIRDGDGFQVFSGGTQYLSAKSNPVNITNANLSLNGNSIEQVGGTTDASSGGIRLGSGSQSIYARDSTTPQNYGLNFEQNSGSPYIRTASADLDLSNNELLAPVIENKTSDPSSPSNGQIWYRSDNDKFKVRRGGNNRLLVSSQTVDSNKTLQQVIRFGGEGFELGGSGYGDDSKFGDGWVTSNHSDISLDFSDLKSNGSVFVKFKYHVAGDGGIRIYRQNAGTAVSGSEVSFTNGTSYTVESSGWIDFSSETGNESYQVQLTKNSVESDNTQYNSVLMLISTPK